MSNTIAVEVIATKILEIRGRKVMLDRELAELYGVETKHLTRQDRRNIKRFPVDFMTRLTRREYQEILRRQIGTLEKERKYAEHDQTIKEIFEAIKQFLEPPVKEKKIIGFHVEK
jgi:hypothetical protein